MVDIFTTVCRFVQAKKALVGSRQINFHRSLALKQ